MEEPSGRAILVGAVKVVAAILSVPAWLITVFFLGWFWPAPRLGRTCDPVHSDWCTPGYGMPQYYTAAVLAGLSTALLLAAIVGWRRRHSWFASCLCAVAAGSTVTVLPMWLDSLVPQWWFFT